MTRNLKILNLNSFFCTDSPVYYLKIWCLCGLRAFNVISFFRRIWNPSESLLVKIMLFCEGSGVSQIVHCSACWRPFSRMGCSLFCIYQKTGCLCLWALECLEVWGLTRTTHCCLAVVCCCYQNCYPTHATLSPLCAAAVRFTADC